ncbi:MAG: zinc-ribbon domain-containing protein [Polyangiaceae bacterium]
MKFLCPSCKAKYQIADEKVIGRTVKMKCRQCGHLIEISEALMDRTSVPGPAMSVPPSALPPAATPSPNPSPAAPTVVNRGATPVGAGVPRPAPPKPAGGEGSLDSETARNSAAATGCRWRLKNTHKSRTSQRLTGWGERERRTYRRRRRTSTGACRGLGDDNDTGAQGRPR